jgi:glycosyltransferase involved in cell wall biosynthesis
LLTRPGDPVDLTLAIRKILGDRYLAEKLIANARERASAFSLDKMTTETSNFYRQILEKHNSSD